MKEALKCASVRFAIAIALVVAAAPGICGTVAIADDEPPTLKTLGASSAAGPAHAEVLDAAVDPNGDIYVVSVVRPDEFIKKVNNFFVYKYVRADNKWIDVRSWTACLADPVYSTESDMALGRNGDVWMLTSGRLGNNCIDTGVVGVLKNGIPVNIGMPPNLLPKAIALDNDGGYLSIAGTQDQKIVAYRYNMGSNAVDLWSVVRDYSDLKNVGQIYVKIQLLHDPLFVSYEINAGNFTVYNNLSGMVRGSPPHVEEYSDNVFSAGDFIPYDGVGNIFYFYRQNYGVFAFAWNPTDVLTKRSSLVRFDLPLTRMPFEDGTRRVSSSSRAITMATGPNFDKCRMGNDYLAYISSDHVLYMYAEPSDGPRRWSKTTFIGDLNGLQTDGVKLFDASLNGDNKRLFVAYNEPDGSGVTVKEWFDNRSRQGCP